MRKKILIVEDDNTTILAYQKKLNNLDCDLDITARGEEAISKLKENKYDLIILDIMLLGKMNGLDVLEIIKRDKETSKIPVIIISNLDSEDNVAKQIGVDDYIVKSNMGIEQITEKIKKYLWGN